MPNDSTATLGATKTSRLLTVHPLTGTNYKSLYSFEGYPDGSGPYAGLVAVNGKLYGTTIDSGSLNCQYGCGTVFEVSTSGKERVLYSFKGENGDGANPMASLIFANGKLYGTTEYGGTGSCSNNSSGGYGCGTVFEVSTSGKERVLYGFKGYPHDGANPTASLIFANGKLYGTTELGGTGSCSNYSSVVGCGIVFKVSTSGTENVLYSFKGGKDGSGPAAGVITVNGTLYGTTLTGGANSEGTAFSLTLSGTEKVLHSFGGSGDGDQPFSGLLILNGTLYGTTYTGGAAYGTGTVFEVSTSGKEHVLHIFKGYRNGAFPHAGLVAVNGTLYGTTSSGGVTRCTSGSGPGCGTIFKVSTSGAEHLLHRFKGGTDGASPYAGLVTINGALYGTTVLGGSSGYGTVFRISP
jgi:uncharacterized repeat protein (TIGR03803 family)